MKFWKLLPIHISQIEDSKIWFWIFNRSNLCLRDCISLQGAHHKVTYMTQHVCANGKFRERSSYTYHHLCIRVYFMLNIGPISCLSKPGWLNHVMYNSPSDHLPLLLKLLNYNFPVYQQNIKQNIKWNVKRFQQPS